MRFEATLDYEHVGPPPSSAVHTLLQRAADRVGRTVPYRVVVSNFEASYRVVASNLAISVIPMEVSSAYADLLGIKMIPLTDSWAHRQFVICFTGYEALQPRGTTAR